MKKIIFILIIAACTVSATQAYAQTAASPIHHFMWGVDFGSSIDMSGNDMTSLDIDAYFGYKSDYFRALGIGAGIHTSLGNDVTLIPVYALLRTSFSSRPRLCFLDLRAGYSFNNMKGNTTQSNPFASAGIGFNLYSNSKFKSHLILAYNFYKMDKYTTNDSFQNISNLSAVSIKLGITF